MERVEGVGAAHIFRGDPRVRTSGIDEWFQGVLTRTHPVTARAHLYGADAGLCARRNVLLEHNTWLSSDTTAASTAYMAIGVALEDMLAVALRQNDRLFAQGMYLVEMRELKIRGKIDLIVRDHEEQLALIEVKSCGALPDAPKPTHLAQAQTYAAVSGIHRTWLTYISRNVATKPWGPGLAMRSFAVDCTEDALRPRLATAALSRLSADAGRLPPVPAHFRKHTECHYCEFRDFHCWTPRPGSAPTGPPDYYPLPELNVEEYINMDMEANKIASNLMKDSLWRKKDTILRILEDYPLVEELENFLRKEYVAVLNSISS